MLIDIPSRVNWPAVIAALADAGISQAELARQIGVAKGTITNLRSNLGEPSFTTGIKILRVYVQRIAPQ